MITTYFGDKPLAIVAAIAPSIYPYSINPITIAINATIRSDVFTAVTSPYPVDVVVAAAQYNDII